MTLGSPCGNTLPHSLQLLLESKTTIRESHFVWPNPKSLLPGSRRGWGMSETKSRGGKQEAETHNPGSAPEDALPIVELGHSPQLCSEATSCFGVKELLIRWFIASSPLTSSLPAKRTKERRGELCKCPLIVTYSLCLHPLICKWGLRWQVAFSGVWGFSELRVRRTISCEIQDVWWEGYRGLFSNVP